MCTFLHKRSTNFSNTEKLKNVWWEAGEMTLNRMQLRLMGNALLYVEHTCAYYTKFGKTWYARRRHTSTF